MQDDEGKALGDEELGEVEPKASPPTKLEVLRHLIASESAPPEMVVQKMHQMSDLEPHVLRAKALVFIDLQRELIKQLENRLSSSDGETPV